MVLASEESDLEGSALEVEEVEEVEELG
jgi:hypothetical protein